MMLHRLLRSTLVCALLLPMSPVWSAGFTLADVGSYAFSESMIAARQGANVAWTTNDQGRRNVWVASGPDFAPRQLTSYQQDDGQEITSLALTDDGSQIVYV